MRGVGAEAAGRSLGLLRVFADDGERDRGREQRDGGERELALGEAASHALAPRRAREHGRRRRRRASSTYGSSRLRHRRRVGESPRADRRCAAPAARAPGRARLLGDEAQRRPPRCRPRPRARRAATALGDDRDSRRGDGSPADREGPAPTVRPPRPRVAAIVPRSAPARGRASDRSSSRPRASGSSSRRAPTAAAPRRSGSVELLGRTRLRPARLGLRRLCFGLRRPAPAPPRPRPRPAPPRRPPRAPARPAAPRRATAAGSSVAPGPRRSGRARSRCPRGTPRPGQTNSRSSTIIVSSPGEGAVTDRPARPATPASTSARIAGEAIHVGWSSSTGGRIARGAAARAAAAAAATTCGT